MENPTEHSNQVHERHSLKIMGGFVRKWREKLGLTQEQFAPIAGFTRSYITEIETGKRNISFLNFVKLVQFLQVDSSELIKLFSELKKSKEKQRGQDQKWTDN